MVGRRGRGEDRHYGLGTRRGNERTCLHPPDAWAPLLGAVDTPGQAEAGEGPAFTEWTVNKETDA